jgi:hypothetical protein
MARQELIKLGAVAPGHTRCMGDITFGNLQQLTQVIEFKLIARFDKGRQRRVLSFQRLLNRGFASN